MKESLAMGPWVIGDLGTPELLILLIVALLILGGLLVLVTLTLLSVKRAADRTAAGTEHHRPGASDR